MPLIDMLGRAASRKIQRKVGKQVSKAQRATTQAVAEVAKAKAQEVIEDSMAIAQDAGRIYQAQKENGTILTEVEVTPGSRLQTAKVILSKNKQREAFGGKTLREVMKETADRAEAQAESSKAED